MRESNYPSAYTTPLRARVSWSPIISGALISFVAMFCLGLFGTGVGFLGASAAATNKGAIGIGFAGALWLALSGLTAFYGGGWITGRMMHGARDVDNVIHGLLSWTTATLAFLLLCSIVAGPSMAGALGSMGLSLAQAADVRKPAGLGPQAGRAPDAGAKAVGAMSLLGFFCFALEGLGAGLGAYAGGRGLKLPIMGDGRRPMESLR